MGTGNCFSSSQQENKDVSLTVEKSQTKIAYGLEKDGREQVNEEIDIVITSNSVHLQSSIRGYFTRKDNSENLEEIRNRRKVFKPEEHFEVVSEPLEYIQSSVVAVVEKKLPKLKVKGPKHDNTHTTEKPAVKLEDGSVYQGGWDDHGNRHGVGTLITDDGEKVFGYFVAGKLEGTGRKIEPTGLVYQGEFKDGKPEGKGEFYRKEGAKFNGKMKDGKIEGEGSEQWPDGTVYDGEYHNGERHGKGKLTLKDGSSYEGEFKNNSFSGKGEFKWANKNEYKGKWKDNKMHGEGHFKWADGRNYKGHWKNDLREGFGEMEWPDGRKYKGGWSKGKQQGEGEYTFKDSTGNFTTKTFTWVDGIKQEDD